MEYCRRPVFLDGRRLLIGDQKLLRVFPRHMPKDTFGKDDSIEPMSVGMLAGRG
jgi:hypothetical protein